MKDGKQEHLHIVPADTGKEIQLATPGMSDARRLELLTAPIDTDSIPNRVIDLGEHDPFNLFEIDDTYELRVQKLLQWCEGIARRCAIMDPDVRDAITKNNEVDLPTVNLSEAYTFKLHRSPVKDKGRVIYSFSAEHSKKDSGFRVIKTEDLVKLEEKHVVLKARNAEETPVDDDKRYYVLLVTAERCLADYAAALSIPIEDLPAAAGVEIKKQARVTKPVRFIINKVAALPRRFVHNRIDRRLDRQESDIRRYLRENKKGIAAKVALSAAVLAPIPGYSTDLPIISWPKPVLLELSDDVINRSEHRRQGFDGKNIAMPAGSATMVPGQTKEIFGIAVGTSVDERIFSAPTIEAKSDNDQNIGGARQDVHGGIRRMDGLGSSGELKADECDEISVDLDRDAQVQVVNVDPLYRGNLELTVGTEQLIVCNAFPEKNENGDNNPSIKNPILDNIFIKVKE